MIFLPGNVPSSKNSKFWTGSRLVNSKLVQTYIREVSVQMVYFRLAFRKLVTLKAKPYKVSFKFIRSSHRRFDYMNAAQTLTDLMVKCEWLADDNADEIVPYFEPYEYNKTSPGVFISVLE